MLELIKTNSDNIDFKELIKELDKDIEIRDGEEHTFFAQFNKTDDIKHVIVAYHNNAAIGCGAFKVYKANIAEIKRMYVRPEGRGKGVATQVLIALENWAGACDFESCILETGKKFPEAIALYKKNNYSLIDNYGQYESIEDSVCFRKKII